METDKTFAERLKEYRERRGWTKRYIADSLQVPYMTWVQWESGKFEPPIYVQTGILLIMKDVAI
jgi:DNA-binding XRE family transcriptional regulator